MVKFDRETVARWGGMARTWLAAHADLTPHDIATGREAWTVASRCGILREAYADRQATDGHIQTALETVFPNAVFLDRKVY